MAPEEVCLFFDSHSYRRFGLCFIWQDK